MSDSIYISRVCRSCGGDGIITVTKGDLSQVHDLPCPQCEGVGKTDDYLMDADSFVDISNKCDDILERLP